MSLKNLDALLLSKGRLIRHAFDIKEATYTLTGDRIGCARIQKTFTPDFLTKKAVKNCG